MATGGTDATVVGTGEGSAQWIPPFQLKNDSGTEMFGVDVSGNVTANGTLTVDGASTLTGAVTASSTLAVTGAITASGGITRTAQKRLFQVGAKVGATSGWAVNAADNKNSLARCPASQTGSTLVVPLDGLKVGDIINSFHLVGQIESAGGTCTVDASLRKQTAAAADLTDGAVAAGAMAQLSVTADTIMSLSNTAKTITADTVGVDETFYMLLTCTTAASTDVDLQAIAITVTES